MPKTGRSRFKVLNVQSYPAARTKTNHYTSSKTAKHILNTTEDVTLEYQIKDEIEIKNEPPRESYNQSPVALNEYIDANVDFVSPPAWFEVQDPASLSYHGGGSQMYAPLQYLQIGNVVVQVVDPEPQYYLVNPAQNVPQDCVIEEQAVIKQVPKKKKKRTQNKPSIVHKVDTSQHWSDVYVQEAEETSVREKCQQEEIHVKELKKKCQQEERSNDAPQYIIGQDDNEVNVHIITKDGKETTTIINTFREVTQKPTEAGPHGESGSCICKICEDKKNKSYVSAFQQFLSQIETQVPPVQSYKIVKNEICKIGN